MNSPYPRRFDDDGTNVTVDLHGCGVDDAVYIVRRTVQEASRRGRGRVVVIHGKSERDEGSGRRTIKSELDRMLDTGALSTWSSGYTRDSAGGRTTIWMPIGTNPNPARIKMTDVVKE